MDDEADGDDDEEESDGDEEFVEEAIYRHFVNYLFVDL